MTQPMRERLNALLPAIYRMRDFAQGEPLRALLRVLEEELMIVEDDVARLYDSWFVETCPEWVLPYIGDLVGARLLHGTSQRAATANTLAYRRRKGTLQTLAALAQDVSGWPARVVEYLPRVAAAQTLDFPRPAGTVTADLRRADSLLRIGTPFDETAHGVDIRTRGRYAPAQVGLYVWRLGVHRLQRVVATAVQAGCFCMNPLGCETALWSPAHSRPGLDAKVELNLAPQPLSRRELFYALEARRQALVDGRTVLDPFFAGEPVFSVFVADADGVPRPVPPEQIAVADLLRWTPPLSRRTYRRRGDGQAVELPIAVALDPERGRLAFPAGSTPSRVWVSYHYGLAGEIGGGYERLPSAEVAAASDGAAPYTLRQGDATALTRLADPAAASSLWQGSGGRLAIEIADSGTYRLGDLSVPAGGVLVLRAARGQRPLLVPPPADPAAMGAAAEPRVQVTLGDGAALLVEGVLIAGGLTVAGPPADGAARIELHHSTLVPGLCLRLDGQPAFPEAASLRGGGPGALTLVLERSICGRVDLGASAGSHVTAGDSILDGTRGLGAALVADTAALVRSTVFGAVTVDALEDTADTLFHGRVTAPSGAEGGVSCCYLGELSSVPSPDRCQPETALLAQRAQGRDPGELRPWFVSQRYGTPGYAQLTTRCHTSLRAGASDEGEIGALHHQHMAQREANLRDSQAEYLRFGLTLNLFLVT